MGNFPGIRPLEIVAGRLQEGGRCLLRVLSLAAAVLARELGVGAGGVVDKDRGAASGKGFENKREKGGNTTEHTGIETSKSPRLVGIQHQRGAPQKAKGAVWGPGGGERSQGKASQALKTSTSAKQPPGCPVSP